MKIPTLRDSDLADKRVLIRVDINSPLDPRTGEILDDARIKSHVPTLNALSESKSVVLAHQSRPGLNDFTTLEKHAERLGDVSGRDVRYVDSVFGSAAREEIEKMENGDILVLENVRYCSEEISQDVISKPPAEQAKTNLVRKLSSYVDFYVNDAFAVSHRLQPSIVAFPNVLPCCMGKVMENEIHVLSKILDGLEKPRIFLFGGAKADDSLNVIKNVLDRGRAETVLTAGVVGSIFLLANGFDIGKSNKQLLIDKGLEASVQDAKNLLRKYKEKIKIPTDLAFRKNGVRVEAPAKDFPDCKILDIGIDTIASYSNVIKKGKAVVANGPCGVFEISEFALGTRELLKAMVKSSAFSVIGGGHLSAIAESMNISTSISHRSTGGKATMYFLAGEKLPGIEALREGHK